MLQSIRDKSQGWIAWVLIILLCLVFGLWGISNYLQGGNSSSVAAKVNGTKISAHEVSNLYNRLRQEVQMQLGRNFHINEELSQTLKHKALETLIKNEVIHDYAKNKGYVVPMAELQNFILTNRAFQVKGKFSSQVFQQFIERMYGSEDAFLHELSAALLSNQIQLGIAASEFVLPNEVHGFMRLVYQVRDFKVARIPAKRFQNQVNITPAAEQAYYKDHQDKFKIPEQVKIQYIKISIKEIAQNLKKEISKETTKLKDFYQNNQSDFTTPPKWHVAHILIPAAPANDAKAVARVKEKLTHIEKELKAGANFAALAKQYSKDIVSARKGGELPWFGPKGMTPAFVTAVDKMKVGAISRPVKTKYGFSIIKLLAKQKGKTAPFSEVKDKIIALMATQKADQMFLNRREIMANKVYESQTTLKPAAKLLGVPVQETAWFSKKTNHRGILRNPVIVKAAFSDDVLVQKYNSDVLPLSNNTAAVAIRVSEHQRARVKSFKAVQAEIKKILVQQAEAKLAKAQGEQLIKNWQKQKQSIAHVANQYHISFDTYKEIKRTTVNAKLSPAVIDFVFKMAHPKIKQTHPVVSGFSDAKGDFVLVALERIHQDLKQTKAMKAKDKTGFSDQLSRSYGQLAINALMKELMGQAKIVHENG